MLQSQPPAAILSLTDLIDPHSDIRILIVHTPVPLNISSLTTFTLLVKIDLSNNNIQECPYLGAMQQVRLLFLHQNRMNVEKFIGVFEKKGLIAGRGQRG